MDLNKAYQLVVDKLTVWLKEFIRLLPNIALAALILVIGLMVARWIKKLTTRLFQKLVQNATLAGLFSSVVYLFSIGVLLFIVLSILNLDKAVTSVLAGAGIIGLAVAFAFQDIAANFMSGVFFYPSGVHCT